MTPQQQHAEAMKALDAGHYGQAEAMYRAILDQRPHDAIAAFYLAQVLSFRDEREDALTFAAQAARGLPKNGMIRAFNSYLLTSVGRVEEARTEAEAVCALMPNDAAAHVRLARLLERCHDLDGARASLERAEALEPNNVDLAVMWATLLLREGRAEDAAQRLEAITSAGTDPGIAHLYWKQRAKVYDKLRMPDKAFEMLAAADAVAETLPRTRMIDRGSRLRLAKHLESTPIRTACAVAQGRLEQGELVTPNGPALVFLVGFPRSGTTMLGQILGAHPKMTIADEKPILHETMLRALEMCNVEPDQLATALNQLDTISINDLRAFYHARAAWHMGPLSADGVLVDKHPLSIMLVGLINVLFPEAHLITLLRDPRDVCLSAYMQAFGVNDMSVNLFGWQRTAAFYNLVMNLWRAQQPQLSMPAMQVRYEDIVADLEGKSRELLDFIGIPWHADVVNFHEKARESFIYTPSYLAVTKRINPSAVKRWLMYREQMLAVDEHLSPLIEAFGYPATADVTE
ncbi:MAG: sulfotransferase [Phycisphaerales bacterium]|nr:sulfotransferase [Phycisphaerales bacterium]